MYMHPIMWLHFCFTFPTVARSFLLGRSIYVEIANLSRGRDGVSYYTETINSNACGVYVYLRSGNETFRLQWYCMSFA